MSDILVTTDWLEQHLDDPSVRVLEIGATDTDDDYRSGHVPGAIRFFWKDLSWHESDRVFGVTINGESRAYPLRIVNAHEMVNDTVGGEPISLLW